MSDHESIQKMIPLLKRYCRTIASSMWEAEDLLQETMLRWYAFTVKKRGNEEQPAISKAFLYKMAINTWIDQHRKQRVIEQPLEIDIAFSSAFHHADRFEIEHALEQLVTLVPLRQSVVLLLHDIFDFKAKEIAGLLTTSEGAIKAALHRARSTLQTASSKSKRANEKLQLKLTLEQEELVQVMAETLITQKPMDLIPLLTEQLAVQSHQPTNLYCLAA